jgi:hypothetical protein
MTPLIEDLELEGFFREGKMVALLSQSSAVGCALGDPSNEICVSSIPAVGNRIALCAIVLLGKSCSAFPLEALCPGPIPMRGTPL